MAPAPHRNRAAAEPASSISSPSPSRVQGLEVVELEQVAAGRAEARAWRRCRAPRTAPGRGPALTAQPGPDRLSQLVARLRHHPAHQLVVVGVQVEHDHLLDAGQAPRRRRRSAGSGAPGGSATNSETTPRSRAGGRKGGPPVAAGRTARRSRRRWSGRSARPAAAVRGTGTARRRGRTRPARRRRPAPRRPGTRAGSRDRRRRARSTAPGTRPSVSQPLTRRTRPGARPRPTARSRSRTRTRGGTAPRAPCCSSSRRSPEGHVAHVALIHLDHLRAAQRVSAGDAGQVAEAGAHRAASAGSGCGSGRSAHAASAAGRPATCRREARSRAAAARPARTRAATCRAGVMRGSLRSNQRPAPWVDGAADHGAELVDGEVAVVAADALLGEQDRPALGAPQRDGDGAHHGRGHAAIMAPAPATSSVRLPTRS